MYYFSKRAVASTFAIYRYITIYGSPATAWIVPGGQWDMGDNPYDACECPAITATPGELLERSIRPHALHISIHRKSMVYADFKSTTFI